MTTRLPDVVLTQVADGGAGIESLDGALDPRLLSKLKFGSRTAAIVVGSGLGQAVLDARPEVVLAPAAPVVVSNPYFVTPHAASFIAEVVAAMLSRARAVQGLTRVDRAEIGRVSLSPGANERSYGSLGHAGRLEWSKVNPIVWKGNGADVRGRDVIIVDDLLVTDGQGRCMAAFFERHGAGRTLLAFAARLDPAQAEADPRSRAGSTGWSSAISRISLGFAPRAHG